jgi:uncharacterized lipoprotein YddW (UPF0748 family)
MKKIIFFIALISSLYAQYFKNEFRGAWIAVVENYDWPSSPNLSVEEQKKELINLLDILKYAGINTIFFHIRTECDAIYNSPYEPWSYWLTGEQGKAPNPYYDPLEFAINEAHKRGMELHIWFNPYRAVKTVEKYTQSNNHITKTHPDWILSIGNYKFLNPGLPEVEDYIIKVIVDVVNRYNIDGVHYDDYFYPYPPNQITTEDQLTFQQYNRGFTNIADWRRDNINRFVKRLKDTVLNLKPYLAYGISPFGIWKSGVPAGITGMDAYNVIYCDAIKWMQNKSVDYIIPQLYWPFGGAQDYATLMNWWADSAKNNNTVFISGNAGYKIPSYGAAEIPKQIAFNRKYPDKVAGFTIFQARDIKNNVLNFIDSLIFSVNRFPALGFKFPGKNLSPVTMPNNLRTELINGKISLVWDHPNNYIDNTKFIVYRFNNSNPTSSDFQNPKNIFAITGEKFLNFKYGTFAASEGKYFTVKAANRLWDESENSNIIQLSFNKPNIPNIIYPLQGFDQIPKLVELKWQGDKNTHYYHLQIANDSNFSNLIVNRKIYQDTFYNFTTSLGEKNYYWRVKAYNIDSSSEFTKTYNFKTGYPSTPSLLYPAHATTNVPLNVTLKWKKNINATSYRLQIDNFNAFKTDPGYGILVDTILTDTLYNFNNLLPKKNYFWRLKAYNSLGESDWSTAFGFQTTSATSIDDLKQYAYNLWQNYPNPFNPTTAITYSIAKTSNVKLIIYNSLGQIVTTLVNEQQKAGIYKINFSANNLSSGVYFYKLQADNYLAIKKMLLIK